jgi:hypothetical protein
MSESDEQLFLDFLRENAEIRIMRHSAHRRDELFIENFSSTSSGERTFWIWNTAFPWEPVIEPWHGRHSPDAAIESSFRFVETAGAPLVEYSREAFGMQNRRIHGRIYWNTWFALYKGKEYDQNAFGRWFDHVVRWLRKRGKRIEIAKGWSQYWLPGALEIEPKDGKE